MWRFRLVTMFAGHKWPIDTNATMDFFRHTPMSNGCIHGCPGLK